MFKNFPQLRTLWCAQIY